MRSICVAAILLAVTACGGERDRHEHGADQPPQETVFDDMTGTLERAQSVEATMQERQQELNREMNAREAESQ